MTDALFGDIDFSGKDIALPSVKFDTLAVTGRGELLLVSLFAESQRVKAIRSILAGGAKVTCQASGVNVNREGDEAWYAHTPGRLFPTEDGYNVHTHRLGFGLVHAMFISRMPGYMKIVTEESLWQELKSDRFTTPLLREWMPWVETKLREQELLENAHCFGCRGGILSASTEQLDAIVTKGIKDYEIYVSENR